MTARFLCNKSSSLNKWRAVTAPWKINTLNEKIDGSSWFSKRSQYILNECQELLSWNKMARHFKKQTTASTVLKEICCPHKNLVLIIDPLEKSHSQKRQYPTVYKFSSKTFINIRNE